MFFLVVVFSVDLLKFSCIDKRYALSNDVINQLKFL